MYLAQTNLEVDTTQVYLYDSPNFYGYVYLTKHVANSSTQIVNKHYFEKNNRDVPLTELTKERKQWLTKIDRQLVLYTDRYKMFLTVDQKFSGDVKQAQRFIFDEAKTALEKFKSSNSDTAEGLTIRMLADFIE